ncbi:ATP-binding cassette domain-containing protein [Amycolatopsis sp. NPDC098790]|uniref:ATP-binding cassette domain-containing protein n=1 Tax=Amycolatopsis sp. NPDC098790 TaxID=3363939 RepID=UPI0038242B62
MTADDGAPRDSRRQPLRAPAQRAGRRPGRADRTHRARRGSLAAKRLAVRWPDAPVNAPQDVDLIIGPGRRLALTGRSGAAKAPVILALMRYLAPPSDRVLLDGANTLAFNGGSVRDQIAWCEPETHRFDSTLREHLRLSRPSSPGFELITALELAQLGGWFAQLPDGLDTALGTRKLDHRDEAEVRVRTRITTDCRTSAVDVVKVPHGRSSD